MKFFKKAQADWNKSFDDPAWGQRNRSSSWVIKAWIKMYLKLFLMAILCIPLAVWHTSGFNFEVFSSDLMITYYSEIIRSLGFAVLMYYVDWAMSWVPSLVTEESVSFIPIIPLVLWKFMNKKVWESNPYKKFIFDQGIARKAMDFDVEKMGLFDGFIIVLGKFEGKFLKLNETLSALVCAPPGTGKTVGVVVPTIFECNDVSMIVNDPKPELCYTTSGYRAEKGPVFIINWGEEDKPEEGIYYPSWNALSPELVPPAGPERDMYIDTVTSVLVQDTGGTSADPHWSNAGRNALAGFVHFVISKCERAKANDYFYYKLRTGSFDEQDAQILSSYYDTMDDNYAKGALKMLQDGKLTVTTYIPIGTWDNIPKLWKGREACVPLILDWITEAQIASADEVNRRKKSGDQMAAFNSDPMKDVLSGAVKEARKYNYTHRAVLELNQLANTPDKERGSILSTALTSISIFKNSAVRARTSHSDFAFKDIRGMIDPKDGKMKPLTIYLSVNIADAKALSVISGMFIELMSRFLITNPPNKTTHGESMGPYPVLFVLDEFPTMPKLQAVLEGPAVGRGQKVSYLLIAQDLGQIQSGYDADAVETLMSTTAVKIVLTQNNDRTAKRFSEMIGSTTALNTPINEKPTSFSKMDFSLKTIKKDLYSAASFMTLKPEKQVVIMQGFSRTPIEATSPRWYKDPEMVKKTQIPSAPPVPEWIIKENAHKRVDFSGSN